MASNYSVFFIQGSSRMLLDSATRMVHDGKGHNLYHFENGRLRPLSGHGTLNVCPDGRILNAEGNQVGFIEDYARLLRELRAGPGTSQAGQRPAAGSSAYRPAGTSSAGQRPTAGSTGSAASRPAGTSSASQRPAAGPSAYRPAGTSSASQRAAAGSTGSAASRPAGTSYSDPQRTAAGSTGTAGTSFSDPQRTAAGSTGTSGTSPSGQHPGTGTSAPAGKKRRIWPFVAVILVLFLIFQQNQNKDQTQVYSRLEDIAVPMREAFLRHDSEFSYSYRVKDYSPFFNLNGYDSITLDMLKIYNLAMGHTGNPAEGDQLSLIAHPSTLKKTMKNEGDGIHLANVTVSLEYYTTKEQEQWLQSKVASTVRSLNLSGKSDYEKIRAIYNWICQHVVYDHARLHDESYLMKYTAYNGMREGTCVCSGYAQLLYRMALTAGLEARIKLNDNHAWNLVRLGGQYYFCDSTWDAGKPESEYSYFLKGFNDFELHTDAAIMFRFDSSPLTSVDLDLPVAIRAYGS